MGSKISEVDLQAYLKDQFETARSAQISELGGTQPEAEEKGSTAESKMDRSDEWV